MARLSAADWLSRLQAKGWTRSQIQAATGASPSTQLRIQRGTQKTSRYEGAIREAGSKYSRRKTVPAEFPHTPKPHVSLDRIVAKLTAAGIPPDVDGKSLDEIIEQFGRQGTKAILTHQLASHNAYRAGDRDAASAWFYNDGPEMMEHYSDGLVDPHSYRGQLWYHGG